MMKLVQAAPYATLMAWINFGGVELSVGHVVALIGILIWMHAAGHYAGFTYAIQLMRDRAMAAKQHISDVINEILSRQQGGE